MTRTLDWDAVAWLIRESGARHARAWLAGDWEYTEGDIYRDGRPVNCEAYVTSAWATPVVVIDGLGAAEIWTEADGPVDGWPQSALDILSGAAEPDDECRARIAAMAGDMLARIEKRQPTSQDTECALPAPPVTAETVAAIVDAAQQPCPLCNGIGWYEGADGQPHDCACVLRAEIVRWRQIARRMAIYARWWRALEELVCFTNQEEPDHRMIARAAGHLARIDEETNR